MVTVEDLDKVLAACSDEPANPSDGAKTQADGSTQGDRHEPESPASRNLPDGHEDEIGALIAKAKAQKEAEGLQNHCNTSPGGKDRAYAPDER